MTVNQQVIAMSQPSAELAGRGPQVRVVLDSLRDLLLPVLLLTSPGVGRPVT